MFQRTCPRPEGVLEKAVRANRRRGAPCHRPSVRIAFVAELFERARKALAADTALGALQPVPLSLAGCVAGSVLMLAADAGLAITSGPARHRGWPAWAEAGDVAARAP